jgi:release factor glutamine methyltransferase
MAALDDGPVTAESLLGQVLGLTRAQLLARPEAPLAPGQAATFEGLVTRAALGEPLAYLTGRREFYGLDFDVDVNVLVPRPETELLVDLARAARPRRALDVGTGSGCIAVALAVHLPEAAITASDVSNEALQVARQNARRYGVDGRMEFVVSDLLAFIRTPTSDFRLPTSSSQPPFDLICANLPYIDPQELLGLPVARFEPWLALDGGPGGLTLVERLLRAAPPALAPGGLLLLEIGAGQGPAAVTLAGAAFPDARVTVERDLAGFDRVLAVRPR